MRDLAEGTISDAVAAYRGCVPDDPFADEDNQAASQSSWVDVPLVRKLVSGKYEAK